VIKYRQLISILCLIPFLSCGKKEVTIEETVLNIVKSQSNANLDILYGQLTELEFKVFYEPNAVPYTGRTVRGTPYWTLLEDNIKKVYQVRSQNISLKVPKSLNQMTSLKAQAQEGWSSLEILSLANSLGHKNPDEYQDKKKIAFTLLFLEGKFEQSDGKINPLVLGVSLSGTTIIAIFKDIVRQSGNDQDDGTAKFIEQSTLIHETGHAMGVVHNGIPLKVDHHDKKHGAHCSNLFCVMYWLNEGRTDLVDFIQSNLLKGNTILYGHQCLNDIKSYQVTPVETPAPEDQPGDESSEDSSAN
jgi:hypothetical protein